MTVIYKGIIFTGIGVAKTRVQQNIDVYKEVTGMELVPGTFNVRLSKTFVTPSDSVYIPPEKILPIEKNRGVILVSAKLRGSRVVILIPKPAFYEKNVIEIMAPFNIKKQYGLRDGDEVEIEV